jgi:hypothetical protein
MTSESVFHIRRGARTHYVSALDPNRFAYPSERFATVLCSAPGAATVGDVEIKRARKLLLEHPKLCAGCRAAFMEKYLPKPKPKLVPLAVLRAVISGSMSLISNIEAHGCTYKGAARDYKNAKLALDWAKAELASRKKP